ncbi:MAG: hypothetical protein IPK16_11145 [Anaerolineales bacterium]|nr:hypothetical protein [Anaerolineales bacterium]
MGMQVRIRLASASLMVVLAAVVALATVQVALGALNWDPARPIPGFLARTLPPIMIADDNRTVHAFASQFVGDGDDEEDYVERVIVYRQWTLADGWSDLNDIVISPLKAQARVKAVHLDDSGFFHLIFYGGDEQEANLYYTFAPAALAGNAHAWSEPVAIGPSPITPDVAGLVGDGKGNMVMVYSGNLGEGNTLYAVYSFDEGVSWTAPERVFSTFTSTEKAFDFQLSYGDSGAVHMVWNVTDKTGKNVSGYYARLDQLTPEGEWSEAVSLAPSVQLGVAIPAVTEYDGEVFVMYNNGLGESAAPVQWFQRSSDGGKTWSEPIRPFPNHIGRNGSISFVRDGSGTLHVFFGQRIPSGGDNKKYVRDMWHATWRGGSWGAAGTGRVGQSAG